MTLKVDANKLLGGLAIALLLFISGKVWQAVEIAAENQVRIEHLRENQRRLQADIGALWHNNNENDAWEDNTGRVE